MVNYCTFGFLGDTIFLFWVLSWRSLGLLAQVKKVTTVLKCFDFLDYIKQFHCSLTTFKWSDFNQIRVTQLHIEIQPQRCRIKRAFTFSTQVCYRVQPGSIKQESESACTCHEHVHRLLCVFKTCSVKEHEETGWSIKHELLCSFILTFIKLTNVSNMTASVYKTSSKRKQ